jgi:hypothetical protein
MKTDLNKIAKIKNADVHEKIWLRANHVVHHMENTMMFKTCKRLVYPKAKNIWL